MSLMIALCTKDKIYVSADCRESKLIDGQIKVMSDKTPKLFTIDGNVIFGCGNKQLIHYVLDQYTQEPIRNVEVLQNICRTSNEKFINNPNFNKHEYMFNGQLMTLGLVICSVHDDYSMITGLSSYNNFEPEITKIEGKNEKIFTHGFYPEKAMKYILDNINGANCGNFGSIDNVFRQTYKLMCDEHIGGSYQVVEITKDSIKQLYQEKIPDTKPILYYEQYTMCMIAGRMMAGSVISETSIEGGTITIGHEESVFKCDSEHGISLGSNNPTTAPFRVLPNGEMTATKATIKGDITSGSTITGSKIQSSNIELEANNLLQGISWKFENNNTLAEIFTDTNSLNIECLGETINIQADNINLEGTVKGIKVGSTDEILDSSIEVNNYSVCAIKANNTGVWGYYSTGNHAVGIDLSNATHSTNEAIRIKADDYISLEKTGIIKMKYNPNNGYIEFYNGSIRIGYIDTTSSDHAL